MAAGVFRVLGTRFWGIQVLGSPKPGNPGFGIPKTRDSRIPKTRESRFLDPQYPGIKDPQNPGIQVLGIPKTWESVRYYTVREIRVMGNPGFGNPGTRTAKIGRKRKIVGYTDEHCTVPVERSHGFTTPRALYG